MLLFELADELNCAGAVCGNPLGQRRRLFVKFSELQLGCVAFAYLKVQAVFNTVESSAGVNGVSVCSRGNQADVCICWKCEFKVTVVEEV